MSFMWTAAALAVVSAGMEIGSSYSKDPQTKAGLKWGGLGMGLLGGASGVAGAMGAGGAAAAGSGIGGGAPALTPSVGGEMSSIAPSVGAGSYGMFGPGMEALAPSVGSGVSGNVPALGAAAGNTAAASSSPNWMDIAGKVAGPLSKIITPGSPEAGQQQQKPPQAAPPVGMRQQPQQQMPPPMLPPTAPVPSVGGAMMPKPGQVRAMTPQDLAMLEAMRMA